MKKILIFGLILIGCASAKAQSTYVLKFCLVERSNTEVHAKQVITKIDTIRAMNDTAAFSEADKRFTIYNSLMIAKYKTSKDSSSVVQGTHFTLTDAAGNDVFTKLPGKYIDSVMSSHFNHHHR